MGWLLKRSEPDPLERALADELCLLDSDEIEEEIIKVEVVKKLS